MAEEMGERTEQPTEKKLSDAKSRGQTGKSQDLAAAIIMIGATIVLFVFGPMAFRSMFAVTAYALGEEMMGVTEQRAGAGRVVADITAIGERIVWVLVPVFLIMGIVATISQVIQVGFMLSAKTLEPNLQKFNIVKGAAKLFGKRSVIRGSLDLLKFSVLATIVYLVARRRMDEIAALPLLTPMAAVEVIADIMLEVAVWVLAALVVLGILDWTYQKWQKNEDLKMTKHEVKDERKSMQGDPEVQSRRMKMARQIAMQQMQRDVPRADVVVTNPTHYAIALKYDSEKMHAPRVLAKGVDYMALRIRQLANGAGVPIVERPPLARALYAQCDVGDEIPEQSYEAVAEVLAFVYQLEGRELEKRAAGV